MYVKFLQFIFVSLFFVFVWSFFTVAAAQAATLKFDSTTYSITSGSTVTVQVQIDPAADQVTAANAYVLYDPTILQAQSVSAGSYFPSVSNSIGTGKVYIWAAVNNASDYKTGPGTLATITFKAIAGGTAALTFDCAATGDTSKISKNDTTGTNIIVCAQNGKASATVSGGVAAATAAPTQAVVPTTASATATAVTPTTALPSQLPQTGAFEDTLRAVLLGSFFIFIAGAARFYSKKNRFER